MTNVFIFHGIGGYPGQNWFPWLKQHVEALGHHVFVPQFPTPENQTLDNWLKVLDDYRDAINSNPVLVGHSLGVPFTLNVLERFSAKSSFLIAGFVGIAGNAYDNAVATFAQREFDWAQIKKNCPDFHVYHSDNDPYISLDKAERVSTKLGVNIKLVEGAGHFDQGSGYTTFALLLDDIKQVL